MKFFSTDTSVVLLPGLVGPMLGGGSEVGGGRPSSAGPCQAVSIYLSSNRPALTLATS